MHFRYVQNMKKKNSLKCEGKTKHKFSDGFYSPLKPHLTSWQSIELLVQKRKKRTDFPLVSHV